MTAQITPSFPAGALSIATPATPASFAALLLTGLLIGPAIPLLLVAAQNDAPERAATASVIIGTAGSGAGLLTGAAALVPAAFIVRPRISDVDPSLTDTARCVIAACRCLVNGPGPDLPLAA